MGPFLSIVHLETVYTEASDQIISLEIEFGAGADNSDVSRDLIATIKTRTRNRKEGLGGGGGNCG